MVGDRRPAHFTEPHPPKFDEWDAKGLAETIAEVAYPAARIELLAGKTSGVLWEISVDGATRDL